MSLIQRLLSKATLGHFSVNRDTADRGQFHKVGFHGDQYLLELIDYLIESCDWFVETGTNVGSTLAYVGREYPDVQCISCEPDPAAVRNARDHTKDLANTAIFQESSQSFLVRFRQDYADVFDEEKALFWLDAHGHGFDWPLRQEVEFVSSNIKHGYVLIDDFKVPGVEAFGYSAYDGQVCSLDYIQEAIDRSWPYRLYYPDYTDHTSAHHPLRGWGLFAVGPDAEINFPTALRSKVRVELSTTDT